MSIESTVYSPKPALSLSQLIESARGGDLELRALNPTVIPPSIFPATPTHRSTRPGMS
jgi:hypothetical protein